MVLRLAPFVFAVVECPAQARPPHDVATVVQRQRLGFPAQATERKTDTSLARAKRDGFGSCA